VAAPSIRRTRRGALDPRLLAAQVEPVLRLRNIERATQKSGSVGLVAQVLKGFDGTEQYGMRDASARGHLGASIKEFAHIGVHGFNTFSKDNQASVQQQPDANVNIFGADVRLTMKQFGHLYAGFSHLDATTVSSLGGVVRYLDTMNGPDLMRNYLGTNSNGTGKLTTIGAQYDFSLASALLGPEKFSGNAPDLRAGAFFMMTMADTTDNAGAPPDNRYGICNDTCRKFGGEIAYKPLSFLTVAARGDQVDQNTNNGRESFTILTPRLIFSSDWNSQDQIVVQYSRYFYGSEVGVRSPGYDPRDLTYSRADENAVSIHATMWW